MHFRSRRSLSLAAILLLVSASAPLASAAASAAAEPPKKELSTTVVDALTELRALTDAKNHAATLAIVDRLASSVAPTSFDAFVLDQIRAQVFLSQGRHEQALVALEKTFRLGESVPGFVDAAGRLEQLNLLAQLNAQLAPERKGVAAQRATYEVALDYIRRWQRETPRPTAEARIFAGSILFQLGVLDSAKPDAARLREALAEIREALVLAPAPSEQAVTLLVAAHLQLGENLRAAEWLETLVERKPENATTWSQLQAIYLSAAAEAEKPADARRLNLRALNVLERAQAHGHLSTSRDRYTQVALLFNLQQFGIAAEQLEKGLASAALEDSRRNWELLASAYSQLGEEARSLETLDRAVRRFPRDGALEFSLAQTLYQQGRLADAYTRAESAVAKPGLEKPGQAKVYLAFLAFELQRYADANRWVAAARAGGDVPAATIDPLARAVADALRERQT